MTSLIESIFTLDDVPQISTNRNRDDVLKIAPVSGLDSLNRAGEIRYEVSSTQYYLNLSESYLSIEFSYTKADGTALVAADDISLQANWLPSCFSQMILNIGSSEIESINQCVGEASMLANLVLSSETYKRTYGQVSGYILDSSKGDNDIAGEDCNWGYYYRKKLYDSRKGSIIFPLKYLFGFISEYNKILYLTKVSLSCIRKDDSLISNEIFYGAAGTNAKLKFEKIEFVVPYIEPSLEIEEIITKRYNTKQPINIVFMKHSINMITVPTGTNYSWNLGKYVNSVRFVFVGFKTATTSPQINNALFTTHDGANYIKSLRLQLNQMYTPQDYMRFNFIDNKLNEPYKSYIDCCRVFGNEPQLSYLEYKNLFPIMTFNISSQPDQLKANSIDLTLHIEKSSALTLTAFALILEDSHYSLLEGRLNRIS
jgi:hypothetical protein